MTELHTIIELSDAFSTPLLGFMAWILWRLKSNDLPHMQDRIDQIANRISTMEGVKAGVELERMKK